MGWEHPGAALWDRDRDTLPQAPGTTSGMAGTKVAVWDFDCVLKCAGCAD